MPTALDLFAGCGGASLGVVRAGFRLLGGYDFEASAVRGHRALLPDAVVVTAAWARSEARK
jgi:site-specific DNA-cytosine methylase